jgi:hypothetical protein
MTMCKVIRFPLFLLTLGLLIASPTVSFAQRHGGGGNWGHHGGGDWGHGHHEGRSSFSIGFSYWPSPYYYPSDYYGDYYYGPYYYRPTRVMVVPQPVIETLPNYQVYVINGVTYYLSNGNYYVFDGLHYQPVAPPSAAAYTPPPPAPAAAPAAPVGTEEFISINVPGSNGKSTTISLKRSGNGFVGPQGETYADFPTTIQLKARYGE